MSLLENMSPQRSAAIGKMVARLPGVLEILGLAKRQTASANPAKPVRPAAPPVWSEEFTVVGVIRRPTDAERHGTRDPLRVDSDVLLPYQTALDLYYRGIGNENPGVNLAVVLVDAEKDVKTVVTRVAELGLEPRAALEFIERERLIYTLIFGGMTCVAGVALLVSALGIANTMLMSVLERTREIGIMKAVGADNLQLQIIFLIEGADRCNRCGARPAACLGSVVPRRCVGAIHGDARHQGPFEIRDLRLPALDGRDGFAIHRGCHDACRPVPGPPRRPNRSGDRAAA